MLSRLTLAAGALALLMNATACQKTSDSAASGDATVVENHTADAGDGTPNSVANPDTLPTATATADPSDASAAAAAMPLDAAFMQKAASGGMMEVEAAKQAQKSADPMVKGVADMILKDHTKANDELKALAAKKDIKLPPGPIDEAKTTLDKLMAVSGKEFDRMYLDEMATAHDKDVAMFDNQSKNGQDADARAFAAKTLPALRIHTDMIKKHQKSM